MLSCAIASATMVQYLARQGLVTDVKRLTRADSKLPKLRKDAGKATMEAFMAAVRSSGALAAEVKKGRSAGRMTEQERVYI